VSEGIDRKLLNACALSSAAFSAAIPGSAETARVAELNARAATPKGIKVDRRINMSALQRGFRFQPVQGHRREVRRGPGSPAEYVIMHEGGGLIETGDAQAGPFLPAAFLQQ
jgi:hypothetical protein